MVKYVASPPPSNQDPELQRYLFSEFTRVETQQHVRYTEFLEVSDPGPHILPVSPADVLVLTSTLSRDIELGTQFWFESRIENTNNQLDTALYDLEFEGYLRVNFDSQMVDETSFAYLNTNSVIDQRIPEGTVINFYASANKRTGMTVSNTRLWALWG